MKLKLKNPDATASDTPAPPPSADASTPASAKPGGGLKIKFKPKPSASVPEGIDGGQDGDAPKAKRKYTKKPKLDDSGNVIPGSKPAPKKRGREDNEDYDSPAAKRKPKPTLKSLAMAENSEDDDDDLAMVQPAPPPRPAVNRTQSIKLKIKPKGTSQGMPAPQRTSTAILKVKGAGKPPVRPYGVGYDSEAEEAEPDPAIESQFILRMQPGEDCDLLRKSIEEKTIGKSQLQGGPGVHFRFFDREGRRAMVTIRGTMYAASMVELPAVIESLKSWNKKDWVKTADVCQMLLVLGKVQNEEEAKKYPRPSLIDPDSHRYPHGLTPPMRWVRKLRFRPRKSYLDVERAEAQMNRLLAEDENADSTKFELVGSEDESEDESSEEEIDENDVAGGFQEEAPEEMDADDLAAMIADALETNDNVEVEGNGEELGALLIGSDNTLRVETSTTAHDVAMHALVQNGKLTLDTETTASTPAAATSADDDDDDDDDADSDEDDVVDEAAAAEERRQEALRAEIEELEKAMAENVEALHRQNNFLFKKRMTATIEKQKADISIKRKQLNEDDND
ncbi:hypothetical protein ACN47E_003166 [Coniothyrium glycines]